MPLPDHRLIICGIPELSQHSMAGVSHVLSIIDTHEPVPPALDDFYDVDHELIRFDDVVAEYPGFAACTPRPPRPVEDHPGYLGLPRPGPAGGVWCGPCRANRGGPAPRPSR